jgi:hypothetical protein
LHSTRNRKFESISLQRRVINEPHIAIKTYLSTGIRLAFSPGVRDASKLAMGGEEFIETLPPDLREDSRICPEGRVTLGFVADALHSEQSTVRAEAFNPPTFVS